MYSGGNSMITPFFHCKILLRKCFSKVKPNRVKQHKKKKQRQMPFTFEQNCKIQVEVANSFIKNSNSEKILGVKIYKKLSFNEHVKNISKKENSN